MPEKTKRNPNGAGRKLIKIDWDTVDKLLFIQATDKEISAFLGIERTTLWRACKRERGVNFATYSEQKRRGGMISLRRRQFQAAMNDKDNNAMLIWLGKQYLGQSEQVIVEEGTLEHTDPAHFRF